MDNSIFKKLQLICLHTVKWFQELTLYSTLFIDLHTVKWFQYNIIPIIQYLHKVKGVQVFLFNTDNSIQHDTFICTQSSIDT